jgi:predicted transcriptional regulator
MSASQLFDKGKVETAIIEALKQTPPPSISELARKFECKRESLKRLFPELVSEMINKRKKFFPAKQQESQRNN